MKDNLETLGSRLKELRDKSGLSQEQVATLVSVQRGTVYNYESDQRRPSFEALIRLAEVFNVTTDYLLGCERNKAYLIDGTGLSPNEITIIRNLVNSMVEKNSRIDGND